MAVVEGARSTSGSSPVQRLGVAPSRTRPLRNCTSSCTSWRAVSASARIRRASGSSASPASVRAILPRARLNSSAPSSVSSARICWESEGCETCTASAARVKCRVSATATK
ncbi:hypothetical protein SMICM304S_03662 [Streptomyces microflavus]